MAEKIKAVVFAGGIGTRMWPLSRKKSPKQFEPIVEGRSTLQLAIDRLRPEFDWQDIYISTGEVYRDLVSQQLPHIPAENIIGEPEMRDVGPAVGYLMALIHKKSPGSPVVILWSDHLVKEVATFKKAILSGAEYLQKDPNKFVYIGQKPRFANQNLGWIEYGQEIETINDIKLREFVSWHYRPEPETAQTYFISGSHAWNPGYFLSTPQFVLRQFEKYAPEMHKQIMELSSSYGTDAHQKELKRIYPTMEKISFDNAVLEKTQPQDAVVLSVDLGWSDIGTWEALKEALLVNANDNLTQGHVYTHQTVNSVVYNYTDQLVTTIDLEGVVVVVTPDVVMVTKQESIPKIKNMLSDFAGTDNEKYT
jgi:mannose-1-phosphate guanylyltransferase